MRAGNLRHRGTIQDYTEAQDSFGQPIKTYSDLATRWISIEPLSGRELEIAKQLHPETTHRIRLRHLTGLHPRQRLIHEARTFEFLSVINPEERDRETVVMAVERL